MATSDVTRQNPFVVVLTGGPSSGKTSALAVLRDRLTARGFQVLTVPENATTFLANSDGFQPEWAGTDKQVQMQRVFLDFQLAQEQAFLDFGALHPKKSPVLLLDCCTLNSKVYLTDEQWEKVLVLPGKTAWTEELLLKRYDLVIHMVTCAMSGKGYEWGPGSNNPGRYQSPEQAKDCDHRCLKVFQNHPQLRVVPNSDNFEDKIGKVVEFVNDALHVDGLAGKRRRRRCRIVDPHALELLLNEPSTSSAVVTCTFLDDQMQQSVRRNVRMPGSAWTQSFKLPTGFSPTSVTATCQEGTTRDVQYERRTKVRPERAGETGQTVDSYLTRRIINEEDYLAAITNRGGDTTSTVKYILRFVVENHYYELFVFKGHDDFILDFSATMPELPAWLALTSTRDLTREDSESMSRKIHEVTTPLSHGEVASGTKVDDKAIDDVKLADGPPAKRSCVRRQLRVNSTEEAAYHGH